MSLSTLADRFNMVQESQKKEEQQSKLKCLSYDQLGSLQIRFGEAKLGQTYQQVVTEDPKYCQWFIRKFASSSKDEHREFLAFLDMWVERKELEMSKTGTTVPMAKAKVQAKAKAGVVLGSPSLPSSEVIDLEEDEMWSQIMANEGPAPPVVENQNAQRLDVLEETLAQMMNQLQLLTHAIQNPVLQ